MGRNIEKEGLKKYTAVGDSTTEREKAKKEAIMPTCNI